MKTSVIGYPRIGELRELKFATEKYFKKEITSDELEKTAAALRRRHWEAQSKSAVDFIPSGDFSFYDLMLDTAVMLNAVPRRYKDLGLGQRGEYFAMARGYQGKEGDVKALAMKKWFHTNYHYMAPEIGDDTQISLSGTKPVDEFVEAKNLGILTKPTVIGPFTFLKLAKYTGKASAEDFFDAIAAAYAQLIQQLEAAGAQWISFEEPALVYDLSKDEVTFFKRLYDAILGAKQKSRVLLQIYFGDIRDCYTEAIGLDFDGIGLDLVEGKKNLDLIASYGFPKDKTLFAGLINGKNIWCNRYAQTLQTLDRLSASVGSLVLGTSCSLLHVPYSLRHETVLPEAYTKHLAFAEEKLSELADLKRIVTDGDAASLSANGALFAEARYEKNTGLYKTIEGLDDEDFTRRPAFPEREKLQREALGLPLLPVTTIGSFPQTPDVQANRSAFRSGRIDAREYAAFNRRKIAECIAVQEEIGIDVLVHGEYERNDMVEYFGEHLNGYIFTKNAWVQSYGTRCVKPPVIWGDVSRAKPITVDYAVYAQSLSEKPVKGMLTGPVTIFNWSFPREDISPRESVMQLALAIREEVLDLEAHGIRIIQIDEAALREKLPLRKSDWHGEYLDWAIPAFRLVHSAVRADIQIHTHMCYSEFEDIIREIDAMDADVISFEASRSSLSIIDALTQCGFQTQVGPGVYDIHSPRVPAQEEIENALRRILEKISPEKLWVNPDCGLKTRGVAETLPSLKNMVAAAKAVRGGLVK